jgi:preprotein translocase SecE subunit
MPRSPIFCWIPHLIWCLKGDSKDSNSALNLSGNSSFPINLSFVAASLLTAYVMYVLAVKFSVVFDVEGRVRSLDKILLVGTVVVGIALFLGLSKSSIANNFMNETVTEVTKVTWPDRDETLKATVAVLIAVTIAGFLLWAVDNLWIYVIGLIIT